MKNLKEEQRRNYILDIFNNHELADELEKDGIIRAKDDKNTRSKFESKGVVLRRVNGEVYQCFRTSCYTIMLNSNAYIKGLPDINSDSKVDLSETYLESLLNFNNTEELDVDLNQIREAVKYNKDDKRTQIISFRNKLFQTKTYIGKLILQIVEILGCENITLHQNFNNSSKSGIFQCKNGFAILKECVHNDIDDIRNSLK